jgi:glycosyltransferase involved in cell wall biosynthesis
MSYEVTVLMPVYNASTYLREAISSVLQQTFTNFELLIIDDGSTDESISIINSFEDKRIRLVKNEVNKGISASLNEGINLASTDLIARMDADDICYPERLALQVEHFRLNPITALLSTSVRVISDNGAPLFVDDFDRVHNAYNLNFICPVYHSTVMFRRSVILKLGGYTVPYAEDLDLWWRLSRKYKLDHLQKILLDYRISDQSLSNVSKKQEYEQAHHELLLRHIEFYSGNEIALNYREVECLRHEFGPFFESKNVNEIVTCLKKLDLINEKIITTPNLNYTTTEVIPYAQHKRDFILYYFYARLPKYKALWLLLRTQSLKLVFKRAKKSLTAA